MSLDFYIIKLGKNIVVCLSAKKEEVDLDRMTTNVKLLKNPGGTNGSQILSKTDREYCLLA